MSKLHPIYVALESYQYSRAIKLAAALPESNLLGKCLLAHAYYKSGQRYPALLTLYKILSTLAGDSKLFCELELEVKYSFEAVQERQQEVPKVAVAPEPASASKKGKKGKKKPAASAPSKAAQVPSICNDEESAIDILDHLDAPPVIPDGWDRLPALENAITDEVRDQF